jgi:hypothetical protein
VYQSVSRDSHTQSTDVVTSTAVISNDCLRVNIRPIDIRYQLISAARFHENTIRLFLHSYCTQQGGDIIIIIIIVVVAVICQALAVSCLYVAGNNR